MSKHDHTALKRALAFIDKASGTALGVAMSGRDHPNPDGALTELAMEGIELSAELRRTLSASTPTAPQIGEK